MWTAIWFGLSSFFGAIKSGFNGFFQTKQQALLMKYLEMRQSGITDIELSKIMSQIIMADAASPHFIVYACRPLIALTFLALIVVPWFGYIPTILLLKNPPTLYVAYINAVVIFLTGYAGLRTTEKIAGMFAPGASSKLLEDAVSTISRNAMDNMTGQETEEPVEHPVDETTGVAS